MYDNVLLFNMVISCLFVQMLKYIVEYKKRV